MKTSFLNTFSGCTALTGPIPSSFGNDINLKGVRVSVLDKVKARVKIINKFPQTPSRIGRGQYI